MPVQLLLPTSNISPFVGVSKSATSFQDVFKISQYLIENDEVLKKLDNKYKLYGELSALLHDIGRAYEVGDMKDKVKPHGYYGADIILKQVEKENLTM